MTTRKSTYRRNPAVSSVQKSAGRMTGRVPNFKKNFNKLTKC